MRILEIKNFMINVMINMIMLEIKLFLEEILNYIIEEKANMIMEL